MFKGVFMAGISLSFVFSMTSAVGQESAESYPSVEISNGIINVGIYLPDYENGYYRGTRFDWSGVISKVEFKGHNYFGEWKETHDPKNHDDITGPVEEFRSGTFDKPSALGYKQALPGEPFIKIGVGLLEKVNEPDYRFWYPYKIIKPGMWKTTYGKDWVEFRQDFKSPNGWSYYYTKRVSLKENSPELVITHSLKNTGSKPIETSQYNHNFFVIDNTPVGKSYVVKFPFDVKPKHDLKGIISAKGKELVFNQDLKDEALFSELEGFGKGKDDYDITVENKKTGAGVRIKGDKPLAHLNFWTIKTTICPEPFVEVNLAPGEQKNWSITYSFFVNEPK